MKELNWRLNPEVASEIEKKENTSKEMMQSDETTNKILDEWFEKNG